MIRRVLHSAASYRNQLFCHSPMTAFSSAVMWDAAAAASIGAATAYALEQRRKRKEEEARQAAEAAQKAAQKNAAFEAARIQNYLQGKAMRNAALQNPNLSETERAAVKEHAQRHGLGAALGLLGGMVTALQAHKRRGKADPLA